MESDSNSGRRDALEAMLSDLGVPYSVEPFAIAPQNDYPRTDGANLVVTIDPPTDVRVGGDIVVGAHYDAAWIGDGMLSRGAVDNAASVVILAYLARGLTDLGLEHRIRIVFFDMEEIGLVGSRQFLSAHPGDQIRAAVNLDVNGYGDTVFYGPSSATGNGELYEVMRENCVREDLPCMEFPLYPASDYRSFQVAGIPNISLSVLPGAEAGDLFRFLNGPAGERPSDTPAILERIHSPLDTSALVEAEALELGLRSLTRYLESLDAVLD